MPTTRTFKPYSKPTAEYRSRQEAALAENLKSRGVSFSYETVHLAYTVHRKYTPDFDLGKFLVEFKGWFKPCDRTKLIAVREANPTKDIRLVFQNSKAKLSKKSNTTYGEWATKHGFKWAERVVPDAWIED